MRNYLVPLIFVILALGPIRHLAQLKIRATITRGEKVTILIAGLVFLFISYYYGQAWYHYLTALLGFIDLLLIQMAEGIKEDGLLVNYRYQRLIKWQAIDKVRVEKTNYLRLTIIGDYLDQRLYFKLEDEEKVLAYLKEKLGGKKVEIK